MCECHCIEETNIIDFKEGHASEPKHATKKACLNDQLNSSKVWRRGERTWFDLKIKLFVILLNDIQTCSSASSLLRSLYAIPPQKKKIRIHFNKKRWAMKMTLTWLACTRLSCTKSEITHPHQCKKHHHSLLEAHFQSFMILRSRSRQSEFQMQLFLISNPLRMRFFRSRLLQVFVCTVKPVWCDYCLLKIRHAPRARPHRSPDTRKQLWTTSASTERHSSCPKSANQPQS